MLVKFTCLQLGVVWLLAPAIAGARPKLLPRSLEARQSADTNGTFDVLSQVNPFIGCVILIGTLSKSYSFFLPCIRRTTNGGNGALMSRHLSITLRAETSTVFPGEITFRFASNKYYLNFA